MSVPVHCNPTPPTDKPAPLGVAAPLLLGLTTFLDVEAGRIIVWINSKVYSRYSNRCLKSKREEMGRGKDRSLQNISLSVTLSNFFHKKKSNYKVTTPFFIIKTHNFE